LPKGDVGHAGLVALVFGYCWKRAFFIAASVLAGEEVPMKILVFEPENSLRELLRIYLAGYGHEVLAFRDPTVCPLYANLKDEVCCCPKDAPCGDVVIIDNKMPFISAIDFLKLQRRRGCKALDANKAVMSASMTRQLESDLAEFGCHHIRKPFQLSQVRAWIDECQKRIILNQRDSTS
jgi:DNA-binding response OmpR family regulator